MILTYNNKIVMYGNKMVTDKLPDNTLLFKFEKSSYDPSSLTTLTGATWTRVSAEPNIWLWDARSVETTNWSEAFRAKFNSYDSSGYVDIIGAGELTIPTVIGMQNGSDYPGMFRNNGNTLRSVCYLSFPNAVLARCLFQNNGRLLRIEGLNLPKVTTFKSMLKNCTNLVSIGSITSSPNLTDCAELFQYCQHLITFPWFNTSNVTDITSMFIQCNSLQTIPLIDTSKITNMSSMFSGCSSLTNVPLLNTINVTNMYSMFSGCSSLTNVPLLNTSKVTNMYWMFAGCTSLTSVPLLNTSNVTNMSSMFRACTSLTSVPLLNTSKVTSMQEMFVVCTSLTNVPLFDTHKVTNMTQMFLDCSNVQSGALALYQQASSQTKPPRSHTATFKNCGINTTTGAAELAQIPTSWGGTMA